MIYVSKARLRKDVFQRISKQFYIAILDLKNTKSGARYLSELLTESEQLLLAKRLAVILMLDKNISWTHIQRTLDISRTTIARVQRQRRAGKFPTIATVLCTKKKRDAFWMDIEILLRAGMPAYGKSRWDGHNARLKKDLLTKKKTRK